MKSSKRIALAILILLSSITGLSSASATVVTFNCGGGGSYSVVGGEFRIDWNLPCVGPLVLDASVTKIPYATRLSSVTSLTIPSTTLTIDDGVISNSLIANFIVDSANPNYKSIDGVLYSRDGTTLKAYPQNKSGISFTIPNEVTTLSSLAFQSPVNLQVVNVTESVTAMDRAFGSCCGDYVNSLRTINVSNSNPNYSSQDGVLFNKNKTNLLHYPDDAPRIHYEVPASVLSFTDAFSGNHNLRTMTLPDGLLTMETYEFAWAGSLESINIPASVTSLGQWPFLGVATLQSINVDPANATYKSIDGVLFSKNGTTLIEYPDGKPDLSYTIPNSVVTVSSQWVWGNSFLLALTIPSGVSSIESGYFNSVTSINFLGNSQLTSIGGSFSNNPAAVLVNYCGQANAVMATYLADQQYSVSCTPSQQNTQPTAEDIARAAAAEHQRILALARTELLSAITEGKPLTIAIFVNAELFGMRAQYFNDFPNRLAAYAKSNKPTLENVIATVTEFSIVGKIADGNERIYATDLIAINLITEEEKHKSSIVRTLSNLPTESVDTFEEINIIVKLVQTKFAVRDLEVKKFKKY